MRIGIIALVLVAGTASAETVRYSRTTLPFPAGINRLIPEGISNNGIVAGWSSGPFNAGGAFTWNATDGTSHITNPQGLIAYNVQAISDNGAVGGRTLLGGPGSNQGVFRQHDAGGMSIAPGLAQTLGGFVMGINDDGVSCGWWLRRLTGGDIVGSAWVFSAPSTLTQLNTLMPEPDSQSQAMAINNSGQVGGWTTITGQRHAFRWSNAKGLEIIETPAGFQMFVNGLNHAGQMVGTMADDNGQRAVRFISQNGKMVIEDLAPVLSCWAMNSRGEVMNDLGHVAGQYVRFDGALRAYLYIPDQFPIDLGDVIGDVMTVTGINNRDEVVFRAMDAEKVVRPYYWSPRTGTVLLSEATNPPIEFPNHGSSPRGINDAGQIVLEQPTAEINTANTIVLSPLCVSDTNADGTINGADLSVLLAGFGTTVFAGVGGDINADTKVDAADLSVLLGAFGDTCP